LWLIKSYVTPPVMATHDSQLWLVFANLNSIWRMISPLFLDTIIHGNRRELYMGMINEVYCNMMGHI
jgi:hypothetical protein